jgi:uncharacterized membrane protein YphA (DoxX/SURF4 family)
MSKIFAALGAAVALAGGDKLAGLPAYEDMFRQIGWTKTNMQIAAAAEVAGGLLMIPRATRSLGGALVATTSAAILSAETSRGQSKLAFPRGLIMLVALAAVADNWGRQSYAANSRKLSSRRAHT